jgi:hypothetical protein
MKRPRFSKAALVAHLERVMEFRAADFRREAGRPLDPNNGYAQARDVPKVAAVHYGEWRSLRDLRERVLSGEVTDAG